MDQKERAQYRWTPAGLEDLRGQLAPVQVDLVAQLPSVAQMLEDKMDARVELELRLMFKIMPRNNQLTHTQPSNLAVNQDLIINNKRNSCSKSSYMTSAR